MKKKHESLTDHKPNDGSKKSKQPEYRSKGWSKMKNTAQKAADEKRKLPAKLVRDGTNKNAPDEKTGKDNRGRDETQRSSVAYKVKL